MVPYISTHSNQNKHSHNALHTFLGHACITHCSLHLEVTVTKFKKEKRTISAVAILCTQVAFSRMLKANFLAPLNSQFCKLGLRNEDVPTLSQKVMAEQERRARSESMKFFNTLNSHTQKKKKRKKTRLHSHVELRQPLGCYQSSDT